MAPAILASESGGVSAAGDFPAKLTKQVFVCSMIAAVGGLMFGYDVGISGSILIKPNLFQKFNYVPFFNYIN